ncbi:FHA domain-containing protein [Tautonia plasticadhaerens]|uniref:Glycogen accumulation regulator GarA n=1 Tax=Tautonia plasticadhaerens TaxID=2527974 RepID=A0A518H4T7_9BACT|nr:FHA domain-containing protein [Tautonia plasticadhaerens]QDV35850.1 Glycogen accumulation regulator GarA [Tautonia plasticadhaerens]
MPARLVPLSPGLTRPIPLERPVLLVGRHLECDAQIPHPRISRRHCCVVQVADRLVIRDLGSRTGVRVNGVPIDEAALEHGDEVAIGPILFRLECPDPAAQAARPPSVGPPPRRTTAT